MTETDYKDGFNAGFVQLQVKDTEAATTELWAALGINNRVSFGHYRYGRIEPKASQAADVEKVFHKYGVTQNIWGK
jgi:hypothetical protein